jgi:hypothetical protein
MFAFSLFEQQTDQSNTKISKQGVLRGQNKVANLRNTQFGLAKKKREATLHSL